MARSDFKFLHRIRVRYSEIDGQAVVFNARYLDYADLAVVEYFRAIGVPVAPAEGAPEFHTVRAAVDYHAPIRLDEEVDLGVRTVRVGRTSLTLAIELFGMGEGEPRADIELIYVHVDLGTHKPVPVPASVTARIDAHAGGTLAANQN